MRVILEKLYRIINLTLTFYIKRSGEIIYKDLDYEIWMIKRLCHS